MITDKQKEDIFLKIAPFELYYYHDDMVMKHAHAGTIRSLSNDFETEESFVIAVNEVLSLNSILFFNMVSKHNLSKEAFIDYVSTQYNVFKENSNGNGLTDWLNYTKKLIFDKDLKYYIKEVSTTNKGAFLNWYNDINKTLPGVKTDAKTLNKNNRQKVEKTFLHFIHNVKDKEAFAKDLKDAFPTETDSEIGVIFGVLQTDLYRIIIIPGHKKAALFRAAQNYFDRNIGTYEGVFDYKTKSNNKGKANKVTPFLEILNPLIAKHIIK